MAGPQLLSQPGPMARTQQGCHTTKEQPALAQPDAWGLGSTQGQGTGMSTGSLCPWAGGGFQAMPLALQVGPWGRGGKGGGVWWPTKTPRVLAAVKPDPPVNLTLQNMSNHQLQLSWHTPYPRQQCVEHAVRYRSNKDTDWTVKLPSWAPHLPPGSHVKVGGKWAKPGPWEGGLERPRPRPSPHTSEQSSMLWPPHTHTAPRPLSLCRCTG